MAPSIARPPPAGKHVGDPRANYYATRWAFDPPIELAGARVEEKAEAAAK